MGSSVPNEKLLLFASYCGTIKYSSLLGNLFSGDESSTGKFCGVAPHSKFWYLRRVFRMSVHDCNERSIDSRVTDVGDAPVDDVLVCEEFVSRIPVRLNPFFAFDLSRFSFMRRFWNQILIWRSFNWSRLDISMRFGRVRYWLMWKLSSNSLSCSLVNSVRKRFGLPLAT